LNDWKTNPIRSRRSQVSAVSLSPDKYPLPAGATSPGAKVGTPPGRVQRI
jgi:hypothetical protein